MTDDINTLLARLWVLGKRKHILYNHLFTDNFMKLGHFGALCLLGVALVTAGLSYWDLQNASFSQVLLVVPFMTGAVALAMAVFPGGPLTYSQAARDTSPDGLANWLRQLPRLHRRAWLLALGLGAYLGFGAGVYLQGRNFFFLQEQVIYLLVGLLFGFLVRKPLRQLW